MSNGNKKSESMIKLGALTILALLGISLLTSSFFSANSNTRMGKMMHGMNGYGNGVGSFNGGFESLVLIIMQLFGGLLLIAALVGLFLVLKKYFDKKSYSMRALIDSSLKEHNCPKCGIKISDEFKFCPACTTKLQEKCSGCNNLVQVSWNCCPYCGVRKEDRM